MQVTSPSNSAVSYLLQKIQLHEDEISKTSQIDNGALTRFVDDTFCLFKLFNSLYNRVTPSEKSSLIHSLEKYRQVANRVFGQNIDENRNQIIVEVYKDFLENTKDEENIPKTFFDSSINFQENMFNQLKSATYDLKSTVNDVSQILDQTNLLHEDFDRLINSLESSLMRLELGAILKEPSGSSPYDLIHYKDLIKLTIKTNPLITLKSVERLKEDLKKCHILFLKLYSCILTKRIDDKEISKEINQSLKTYESLTKQTETLFQSLYDMDTILFRLKESSTADKINSYVDYFSNTISENPESLELLIKSIELRTQYETLNLEFKTNKKKKRDSLSVYTGIQATKAEKIDKLLKEIEKDIFPYSDFNTYLIDDLVKDHLIHLIFCLILFQHIQNHTNSEQLSTLEKFVKEITPQLLLSVDASLKAFKEDNWNNKRGLLLFLIASTEILKESKGNLFPTDMEEGRLYNEVRAIVARLQFPEPSKEMFWSEYIRPYSEKILGSVRLKHIIQDNPPFFNFSKIGSEEVPKRFEHVYVDTKPIYSGIEERFESLNRPTRLDDLFYGDFVIEEVKRLLVDSTFCHPDLIENILKDRDLCLAISEDLREGGTLPSLHYPPVGVPNFASICYRTASLQIALPTLIKFMQPNSIIKKWALLCNQDADIDSIRKQLQVSNALKNYLDSQAFLEKNNIDLPNRATWLTKADEDLATALITSQFMFDLTEETRYSQQDAAAFLEALLGDILNSKIDFEDIRTVQLEENAHPIYYQDPDTLLRLPVDEAQTLQEAIHHLSEEKKVHDPQNKIKPMIDGKEIEFEEYTKQTRIVGEFPHHLFIHMKRRLYKPTGEYVYSNTPLLPPENFRVDLSPLSKVEEAKQEYVIKGFIEFSQLAAEAGHYTAYVQRENTFWYHVNDFTVTEVTPEEVKKALETAYIIALEKAPTESQV